MANRLMADENEPKRVNSDREYRVTVHPTLQARVAYTDDRSAMTVTVEYRRNGKWEESAGDIELRGRQIAITRDGESLLEKQFDAELIEEYGSSVVGLVRRLTNRGKRTVESEGKRDEDEKSSEPDSWPVAVTQDDGSVVEALRPPAQATFQVYKDHAGEWRWRLVHRNGNIIADGGEGYSSKRAAKNGIKSVKRNAIGAPMEETEEPAES
ncbi:HVO_2922 family protein [Haladaptatus sp. AB643]|uniref:HVO_2922 family protein n=1 Tax=unclassified Haladaptatus TaxID=2622732 RepID=UPI00209C64BB|nr:YegP family protein [Haladaptatus sp. AB643]MCO8253865.1 YegP family protein [Haladaptatus sp. AB618]